MVTLLISKGSLAAYFNLMEFPLLYSIRALLIHSQETRSPWLGRMSVGVDSPRFRGAASGVFLLLNRILSEIDWVFECVGRVYLFYF